MKKRGLSILTAAVLAAGALAGCSGQASAEAVDLNSMSTEEILKEAQKEGRVDSVGMPDTWANWVETWEDLKTVYGLEHTDTDCPPRKRFPCLNLKRRKPQRISVMWDMRSDR